MSNSKSANENLLSCDIVMAGGVTSGIIYPGAVARIAEKYRFHSIGGTSAGAIAAAATAAAEYRRQETGSSEGFAIIAKVPDYMSEKAPDGRTRLFHLFTPDGRNSADDTRPVMSLLSPLIGQGGPFGKFFKILWGGLKMPLVAAAFVVALLPALPGILTLWLSDHRTMAILAAIAALAFAFLVAMIVLAILLNYRWLPAMARNGFGICTGLSDPEFSPEKRFQGLTPWMHETIQQAAGRTINDDPLTFRDLWNAGNKKGQRDRVDDAAPRNIELSMITSDVSRQRSAQFPFLQVPTPLYFRASEMDRYFPENVVKWMTDHPDKAVDGVAVPSGVFRLPAPRDLPVLLAARMSLSFPILLSAVPLLAVRFRKKRSLLSSRYGTPMEV